MIIVDDLVKAWNILIRPDKNTSKAMNFGTAVKFFYKATIIPFIIVFIIQMLTGFQASALTNAGLPSMFGTYFVAISLILGWVLAPIVILLSAAVVHFFGAVLLKKLKRGFWATFGSVTYAYSAGWILNIILTLVEGLGIDGVVLGIVSLVISLVIILWKIYMYIVALANQHKTTKWDAFLVYLVGVVVIVIIVIVVVAILAGSGLFGPVI